MAQTESRAGFRLPWNSERSSDDQSPEADTAGGNGWDADATSSTETAAAGNDGWGEPSGDASETVVPASPEEPRTNTSRKPSKFLADLTKAMQAAAEEARGLTISQFQAEAKTYVERIHERSATEAANLRRGADDDVAAVREWSKAEIARIREETETRITSRKARLESEIEEHAGLIEREIEAVQGRVAAFEQEMADFFERLLAEDDPTRFATMAERLPEPPPFEDMATTSAYEAPVADAADATAESIETEWTSHEPVEAGAETVSDDGSPAETADIEVTDETTTGDAEPVTSDDAGADDGAIEEDSSESEGFVPSGEVDPDFELDREAAFAAIQAAAEAAASAEVATDAAERAEAVADIAIEIVGSHDDADGESRGDAAAATDFDAAEAEAAATADAGGDVEEIPMIGDEALAARLSSLLPGNQPEKAGSQDTKTTQVVVVGLVSVASIASFKRHLGRLNGVQSVGVSSGPDGEFLFAVHHGEDVVLRDLIPTLPSFQARVTASGDGTLNVTAHDPESD